jgi:D-lactate dehydrogenase
VTAKLIGDERLAAVTEPVSRRTTAGALPGWSEALPRSAPPQLPATTRAGAAAVYLPACLNRIFGRSRSGPGRPTLPEALVSVSARAGLPVWIPDDVAGHCCGVPWSSKGYRAGHDQMAARTAAALARWSDGGRLPVVVDASSCTLGIVSELEAEGVEVLDSVAWLHDHLLARLPLGPPRGSMLVHPTCACSQLGLAGKLRAIAERLAEEVVIPAGTTCCGMAGDRGLSYPELPASALEDVVREIDGRSFDAAVSSNRTCEIALHQITGREYDSIVLMLEERTR